MNPTLKTNPESLQPVIATAIPLLSFLLFPAPVLAHSVQTDYRLVADALEFQATFSTGEAMVGAEVKIYAPNDSSRPWFQGKTDQQGMFEFLPDRSIPGEWSVEIGELTSDHGDQFNVPVSAQGVDVEAISHHPSVTPYHAARHLLARQITAMGMVLGSVGTVGWWRWRRRGARASASSSASGSANRMR